MEKILLGTYTRDQSKGIYEIELNDGKLDHLKLIAQASNPTYLDFDQETSKIYSVIQDGKKAGVAVWDYNEGQATLSEAILDEGVQPCYIRYDKENDYIYDANYHHGRFRIYKDGAVEKEFQYKTGAKAHFADIDPKTGDVFVCDLGLGLVHKYRLLNEIATYKTQEGMGPRHLVFHPSAPYLYVLGELNNTIEVLKDAEFDLELVQTVDTLNGLDCNSAGGAIRISDDGKFVYATNRGHDSIVVFKIMEDFTLEFVQLESVYGAHPRDFALSHDQNYVVVASRDTNSLTLFKRDQNTGRLDLLQKDVYAPEVVSVLFI